MSPSSFESIPIPIPISLSLFSKKILIQYKDNFHISILTHGGNFLQYLTVKNEINLPI
jgi:hypothetical protein